MLAEVAPSVCTAIVELSQLPNLRVVEVTTTDLVVMTEGMMRYLLRPRDALHYAAMVRVGCTSIASTDTHFDRVPAIRRYTPQLPADQ